MKETEKFAHRGPQGEADRARSSAREKWLSGLELKDKHRVLFELEILLKGLDRFFNVKNLPLANMEQVIAINFIEELEIVLQFVDRIVELSEKLLEASRREDYQFQYYIETKLLGDYERTRFREAVLCQDTPEASLFVLYSTFLNIRELLRGLTDLKKVPYTLFFNAGNLITREIVSNRFFNPVRDLSFRPEYDRVVNRRIKRIVKGINEPVLQREVSLVVLAFNRLLQYLSFIDPVAETMGELKRSLLFFALINSESKYLREYMENNLPGAMEGSTHQKAQEFTATCDSLSFQLNMELKKIQSGELMNLSKHTSIDTVRTAVENSHGILTNFFQQSIIALLSVFHKDLQGEEVFPVFISRRRQSVKLREDVAMLDLLMNRFEEITETTEAGEKLSTYVKYLTLQKGLAAGMRKETVPYMRHQDLVEFEKYFRFIDSLSKDDLDSVETLDKFKMESKFFKIFVETTLGHISNRADLQGIPLDEKRVKNRLKRFIAGHLKI